MVANRDWSYDTMHNRSKSLMQHDLGCLPIDMHHYGKHYNRLGYYYNYLYDRLYNLKQYLHELLSKDIYYYD